MKQKSLVMVILMSLGGTAYAQGPYLGVGAGQSTYDIATDQHTTAFDDTGTAWKLFAGYMFTSNLGIELGYADHGKAKLDEVIPGSPVNFVDDYQWNATSIYAAAVGVVPLDQWVSLIGKAGIHRWDMQMKYNWRDYAGNTLVQSASGSVEEDGISPMVAVGVEFNLMSSAGLRFEFERYFSVGESSTTTKSDIDVIAVSATFRF